MLFGTNRNITKEDLLYEADIVKEKFNSAPFPSMIVIFRGPKVY